MCGPQLVPSPTVEALAPPHPACPPSDSTPCQPRGNALAQLKVKPGSQAQSPRVLAPPRSLQRATTLEHSLQAPPNTFLAIFLIGNTTFLEL